MTDQPQKLPLAEDDAENVSLAYQQALKYGQDLQRIYLAEKERRRELEIANVLLNTVFDSAPDGLLVLDDNYTILASNPALARLIETTPDALVGASLAEALPADAVEPLLDALSATHLHEVTTEIVIREPITRLLSVNAARLEASQQPGWVLSFRDQTDRRRLEYQKVEFINIAAHELRTPLTSVIGLSELLREIVPSEADPDVHECVDGVVRGAHRLSSIVDQLIQFAQLTEGYILTEGDSEILAMVNEVLASVEAQAHAKDVSLTVESTLDPATPVPGSPMLLRAALLQLVLNGINFNQRGGSVTVELGGDDDTLQIDITDTGIGIPQAEMEAVFQPFVQVEDHNIRRVGGLGLGLSIVQHAVARLDGSLAVDSQLDEGTHVRMVVPREQPEQNELAVMQARLEASNQQLISYAQDLSHLRAQMEDQLIEVLTTLLAAALGSERERKAHFEQIVSLAQRTADEMELSSRDWTGIWAAAALHELQVTGNGSSNMARRLTTLHGASRGERTGLLLSDALPILAATSERFDGTGTPHGLAGSAIPLGARLLAVVNAYLRLTGPRGAGLNHRAAAARLTAQAGGAFDPAVVDALLRVTESTR